MASSYYNRNNGDQYSCGSVFDSDTQTSWAADTERNDAWIFIDLKNYYELSEIFFHHRFNYPGYNLKAEIKKIRIQFSEGQRVNKILSSSAVNRIKFRELMNTSSVNITVTEVHHAFIFKINENSSIGFSEVKFCDKVAGKNKGDFEHSFIDNYFLKLIIKYSMHYKYFLNFDY